MIQKLGKFMFPVIAVLAMVATNCQAQSVRTLHVRDAVRSGQASATGRLPSNQVLQLDLVLQLSDQVGLESFLKDLYDPTSPSYRHFLTPQEFTARFGPSQSDYDAVVRFAETYGFQVVGGSRDSMEVQVKGSVANIEAAFHVNMRTYQRPTENRTFYGPDSEPTLDLPFNLWHISGLDNYSLPHAMFENKEVYAQLHGIDASKVVSRATTGSGPSASFLGSDMRAAYYGGALTGAGQKVGLFEYYGTDLADLTTYFTNVHQTNSVPVTVKSTDGTSTSCLESGGCDDTEQTLDMTQALGMAPDLSSLVMYVGSTDTAIIGAMTTDNPLPGTIGCSWGWTPVDPTSLEPYFKKMAAQGQNFFVASGDSSTWKASTYPWPAEDAYVVTVGGTDLVTAGAGGAWSSETAWVDSGGGISPARSPSRPTNSSPASSPPPTRAPQPTATAPTFPRTQTSPSTSAPTKLPAPPTPMAEPALPRPCGPPTSPSSTSNSLLTANPPSDSSTPPSTPKTYPAAASPAPTPPTSTTSPAAPPAVIPHPPDTTSLPVGAVPTPASSAALTGSVPTEGYTLSASPVSIVQGSSGASTITSTPFGGYAKTITLSVSGLPSGVTVQYGTNPFGPSGNTTITFVASATAATGTTNVSVTGTGADGTVEATTVSLTVTAAPSSFTIGASPTSLSVARGSSGTTKITTTVTQGSISSISLSASGQKSGTTISFSPSSIAGSGSSTMKVTVNRNATRGTFSIVVKGTGGGNSQTVTVTLTVH